MSTCPICKKRVKTASGDKIKRKGVWQHKHKPNYTKKEVKTYEQFQTTSKKDEKGFRETT